MGKQLIYLSLLFLMLFSTVYSNAQATITPDIVTLTINNKSLYTNGTSSTNQISSPSSLSLIGTTTLAVSAGSNFTNSANGKTIPAGDVTVNVTSSSQGGIALSNPTYTPVVLAVNTPHQLMTATTLLSGGTVLANLQYTLKGSSDLLIASGTYSATLTYTLTVPALLVGSTIYTGTMTLNIVISPAGTITIQNGGGTSTLTFSTVQNYLNGVSLTQTKALNVFGTPSYAVSVQASGNLKNGSNFIGIGNIHLTPTANPSGTGISTSSISFSQTAQNIITSTTPTLSQDFDLKYFTPAANTGFLNQPTGTYTTTLTYTITAP